MKISEFEKPQLSEGFLDALIGDGSTAAIKSVFNPGMTAKTQEVLDRFMKEFVADAIASLQSAVKSGAVAPGIASPPEEPGDTEVTPVDPSKVTPVDPSKVTPVDPSKVKPDTSKATEKYKRQLQQTQNMNQYVQSAAKAINSTKDKNQKILLTKELVNYMADRKGYPEWENGLATVQQVIKKGNVDPNFANSAINKIKAGQTMTEAWKIYYINKLLESVGFTWHDLGLTVLRESRTKKYYIAETKYLKLNHVFEGIVNVNEIFGKKPLEGAQSVSSYMMDWFGKWMVGVEWTSQEPVVKQLINNIEKNYPRGNWKGAIRQLAQAAYAYSEKGPPPKGMHDAPKTTTDPKATKSKVDLFGKEAEAEEAFKVIMKNNPALAKKYGIKL
jgi:hypothetical protein